MSTEIKYNGCTFREPEIKILQALRENGGAAPTSDLLGMLPQAESWATRQGIDYRMQRRDTTLIDAGVVIKSHTVGSPPNEQNVWQITDEGRDFLDLYGSEIEDTMDVSDAVASVRRLRQTIDKFAGRVEKIETEIEAVRTETREHIEQQTKKRQETEQLVDTLQSTIDDDYPRLINNENDIDELHTDLEDVNQTLSQIQNRLNGMEERISTNEKYVHINRERLDEIEALLTNPQ